MPNTFVASQHVSDIVTQFPKASDIFKQYRIDFCCGGQRPLAEAAAEKNVDESEVLEKINHLYAQAADVNHGTDWTQSSYSDLINHIVHTHHAYLYQELPQLRTYVTKIYKVHGDRNPELKRSV